MRLLRAKLWPKLFLPGEGGVVCGDPKTLSTQAGLVFFPTKP